MRRISKKDISAERFIGLEQLLQKGIPEDSSWWAGMSHGMDFGYSENHTGKIKSYRKSKHESLKKIQEGKNQIKWGIQDQG